MKTYLTQFRTDWGKVYAGPEIQAHDWSEANRKAWIYRVTLGCYVIGERVI